MFSKGSVLELLQGLHLLPEGLNPLVDFSPYRAQKTSGFADETSLLSYIRIDTHISIYIYICIYIYITNIQYKNRNKNCNMSKPQLQETRITRTHLLEHLLNFALQLPTGSQYLIEGLCPSPPGRRHRFLLCCWSC